MIYLGYTLAFLLTYVLQTTALAGWALRPELILLCLSLCVSGRSYAGLLLGCATGLFLDVANGYGFYNTFLYGVAGLLCGFMPVNIFRDLHALAFVNMMICSVWLNVGYAILTRIFMGQAIFLAPLHYAAVLLLNIIFFHIGAVLLRRKRNAYD